MVKPQTPTNLLLIHFNAGLQPHVEELRNVLARFVGAIKTGAQNSAAGAYPPPPPPARLRSPRPAHLSHKHSPDASLYPPFYAGRAKAIWPRIMLAVYRRGGFEEGEEPLLPNPITLYQQPDSNKYRCTLDGNDENRAFRDLFLARKAHSTAGFPTKNFNLSQYPNNKWVHDAVAHSFTNCYDFVVVDQLEK
jgi:hypothetical protein